ncbi:MBL fold metallo-hydrolase [Clostridium ihumii]|uniref:MBL fold metallo-hydrolase n=1 Tax=Clostridium ihumii TaxID=1470356 RepID=UPI003D34EA34
MLREVYKNIYVNEIPLPKNPLKAIKSYIIKSKDKNLIIDTGFNIEECRDVFFKGIEELKLDFNKTELFLTHLHSDHSGMASELFKKGVKIYASEKDGQLINKMTTIDYWENFEKRKVCFDLEKDNVSYSNHPGYKYCPREKMNFTFLKDGDKLQVGEYNFKVIDISGHTPGQIGLYDEEHKIFFCGDHILDRITPNITFWSFEMDALKIYFENLNKIYDYDIKYLFTAHRSDVNDHKQRINEIFHHHNERINEILDIVKNEKKSPRDIATEMTWAIRCKDWDDFPNSQKWFAVGEVMAHLQYLKNLGKVKEDIINNVMYYKAI